MLNENACLVCVGKKLKGAHGARRSRLQAQYRKRFGAAWRSDTCPHLLIAGGGLAQLKGIPGYCRYVVEHLVSADDAE